MATSPQRLTIYLYSAHRAVIFAIAQLSCFISKLAVLYRMWLKKYPNSTQLMLFTCKQKVRHHNDITATCKQELGYFCLFGWEIKLYFNSNSYTVCLFGTLLFRHFDVTMNQQRLMQDLLAIEQNLAQKILTYF